MPALLSLSFPFSAEFGNATLDPGCRAQKPMIAAPERRRASLVSSKRAFLDSADGPAHCGFVQHRLFKEPLKRRAAGQEIRRDLWTEKKMGFKLAVVGATGNVGREMLDILAERRFPADEVVALASSRSIGTEVSFGDKILKCKSLEHFDFSGTDICLMSAGGAVSKEWSPKIGAPRLRRHR